MERGGKFTCSLTKSWVSYLTLKIQYIRKLLLEGKIRFPSKIIFLNFVTVAAVVVVFLCVCVCYYCTLFSILSVNMIKIKENFNIVA